jgi:hypothetical protein
MLASLLIIGFSLILLVYWFRYTCILLLRNAGTENLQPAKDLRLNFQNLQDALNDGSGASLESLRRALDKDYEVLTYLLEHAASLNLNPFERHVLAYDYRLMRVWYRLARIFSPAHAGTAVSEMASIVTFLAHRIGSQAAQSRA